MPHVLRERAFAGEEHGQGIISEMRQHFAFLVLRFPRYRVRVHSVHLAVQVEFLPLGRVCGKILDLRVKHPTSQNSGDRDY